MKINIPFLTKANTYWISARVEARIEARNELEAAKRFRQTVMFANRYLSKIEAIDIERNTDPEIKKGENK